MALQLGRQLASIHYRFLSNIWMNQYFRGALSGLGLLNMYVAAVEAGRQIMTLFSRKPSDIPGS